MDLGFNQNPCFTRAIVEKGLLSSPLVVIDVGVYGGIHPRWRHLGLMLEAHGFDAREETITPLRETASPGERYYPMALGNEDGERELFVCLEGAGTSFYPKSSSPYDVAFAGTQTAERRMVPIRRLDTLLREGKFDRADVIKIDCEGFEPEVLKGAAALLEAGVLGVELESSFNVSPTLPLSHFWEEYRLLLPHNFLLYDLNFNRVPRARFAERARNLGATNVETISRPATVNIFFYREGEPRSRDELLKKAIILELYGMNDSAYDELTAWPGYHLPDDLTDLLILPSAPKTPAPTSDVPATGKRKNWLYSLGLRTRLRRLYQCLQGTD